MNANDITFDEMSAERFLTEMDEDEDYGTPSGTPNFGGGVVTTTQTPSTSYTYVGTAGMTGSSVTVSGGAVTTGHIAPVAIPFPVHTFDLCDMGIIAIGKFDANGNAVGWLTQSAGAPLPAQYPNFMTGQFIMSLMSGPDYHVMIRGIFSKYFTNERRIAMGLSPL